MFRKVLVLIGILIVAALAVSGCGGKSSGTPGNSGGSGPTSVSVTVSSATVDGLDTTALSATVANDNHADGVTWSVNGAGTLSNQTTTSVTYTAPAATSSAQSVTVMAVSVKETTKYATTTLTIPPPPAITTASSALAGQVGTVYSVQLVGSGGVTPYTWTVVSGYTLPAGLSLSTAGVISGIPVFSGNGTTSVVFQLKDAGTPTAVSTTLRLGVAIAPAPAIAFTGTMPVAGSLNQAYAGSAAASGGVGALNYTLNGGALPAGLNLNASTGAVTGTIAAAGNFSFTVMAADAFGDSTTQGYQIVVNQLLVTVTPGIGSLPIAITGQTYSQTLTAAGGSGTGYTWVVSGLSNGLAYSANGASLTIHGPATTPGTVNFTATVSDSASNGSGTLSYSIQIYSPLALPSSNPATLSSTATLNAAYSGTVAASGGSGNYAWTVIGLPSDSLNYSTSGATLTISGTPGTAATVTFTAKVTDTITNLSVGPYTYTVTVYGTATLPAPNPTSLGPADAGTGYNGTISVAGGSGSYNWTVTGLSDGLSYLASGATLTISGTPGSPVTVSFNATVTDTSTNTIVGPYTYTIAVYGALVLPAPDPVTLPSIGYTGEAYSGTINASGGSGNYSWQVTGVSDNLTSTSSGSVLTIGGTTGSTPATVTFNVSLKDTSTGFSVTQTGYNIAIGTPTPVTLPAPNPASLPSAVTTLLYSGSINASGGVPPYTWSVNGTTIPTNGAAVGFDDGISVSSNGSNVLSIGGTPSAIQLVNLANVKVLDSLGSNQTNSYTIAVNGISHMSGQIALNPTCGGGTAPVPAITVSLRTSPGGSLVQSVTTGSGGNFTFSGVLNGIYTISPSITGPSSVFYPATQSVTVDNADLTGENFIVALGYTVSGTVSYSGSNTGQVYLWLNPTTNCGSGGLGTSVFTPGAFTIRGVPPGTYTLQAWMDLSTLANGALNTSDPSGSTPVTVAAADVTGTGVTLTDNTPTSVPSANSAINAVIPTDHGVAISFKAVSSNGVEAATSYDVQWSTDSTFATSTGTCNFKAIGTGSNVWILNNGISGITGSPFTNGQTYYFEARARNAAGPASGWTIYGGSTPTGVSIGAFTSGNQVQGTVTIPAAITPAGPLYVGYYNRSTSAVYATRIASPGNSNPFTVYVPTDTYNDYIFFEILDQNNDGLIDAGDVTNTNGNNVSAMSISGPLTDQNLTLSAANSTARVTTQYYKMTGQAGSSTLSGYNLNFDVRAANKMPVTVTLMSGPNVINPVDIGNNCQGCGSVQFQYHVPVNPITPSVGDTYTLRVTYSDSSSDTETLTSALAGWNGTTSIVGPGNLATNLSPSDQGSLVPTFAWSDPDVDSSDLFSFYQFDPNGNTVWQVPGSNSNSNGFSNSIISIDYGTDPTTGAGNNPPSISSLTDKTNYSWEIQAQDSNGNQALQVQVFQASGTL